MRNLLIKECRLSAHILSYLFILFGLMALIPGYPITLGAFFVCLGLFQTFQAARENNDILFTALLPVAKTDVVRARYAFVAAIELVSFALMFALTIVRMTALADAPVYVDNAMMNANQVFLAWVLIIFAVQRHLRGRVLQDGLQIRAALRGVHHRLLCAGDTG